MNRTLKIIQTADGSSSIFWKELNETYHSLHGATQESRHVYIKSGLSFLASKERSIRILEVGFGTGLNVLLTIEFALNHPEIDIQLTTLEPYPLPLQIVQQLDFLQSFGADVLDFFLPIHALEPTKVHQLLPNFQFQKHYQKLEHFSDNLSFDLVYYDAFAPSKQAEMWTFEALFMIHKLTRTNSVLVTYSSNGKFRKSLIKAGFDVYKIAGPVGKREMVRAIRK